MYFCIEKTGISLKQEKVAVLGCDFYITFFTYEKFPLKLLHCFHCKIFISNNLWQTNIMGNPITSILGNIF